MTITRDADGEAYHHGLQCSVRSASYSFRERRGRLDLEALCCCSMTGAVAMFELHGGLILALYPRTELAKDANVAFGAPKTGEFSIGQIVEHKEDVDRVLAQAAAAGATLTDRPHDRPWGIYSGYFRDPDGHLWEIIWNPRRENS